MRVEFTLAQFDRWINRFSLKNCVVASLCLFLTLNSCTNISHPNTRSPSSTITQVSPTSGVSSGNFYLLQVVPDPNSPGVLYDLIGQNSEYDTYCGGTHTCQCEFTYTQPGVGVQTVQAAVTYQESNQVRCLASTVPAGISTFDVRILSFTGSATAAPSSSPGGSSSTPATAADYSSNSITVNLSSNGAFAASTNYVDLSQSSAYVMVQRFQCRKREFIANPIDSTMIDPIQSIDPAVVYPFNFYTTNVADSLLFMQKGISNSSSSSSAQGDQSWDCTLNATLDRSMQWWANPVVFSATTCNTAFCSGDQELIYPTTTLVSGKVPVTNPAATGKRRASFYLSGQSYGVFQVPVIAPVAPLSYVSATFGSIGYAAKPVPNVSGSSSCPSIPIPSNAHWVKIWNYRATDLTPPKVVTSTFSGNTAGIGCYPDSTSNNVFPSCDSFDSLSAGAPTTMKTLSTPFNTSLAGRIGLLSGSAGNAHACYKIDTGTWTAGSEKWTPSAFKFYTGQISVSDMAGLPWNLYVNAALDNPCGSTGANTPEWMRNAACGVPPYYALGGPAPGGTAVPADNKLQTRTLASSNYTDSLFVVTDPDVDDNAMRNSSSAVSQYIPVTYRSASVCPGPSRLACPPSSELHWGVNVKESNNAAPIGPDVFPLCALQFTD